MLWKKQKELFGQPKYIMWMSQWEEQKHSLLHEVAGWKTLLRRNSVWSCCCSIAHSFLTLWSHGLQQARLPCPSLSPGICSNSCPLSWWCHPTISSSVSPFSSYPQSFQISGSFPMSLLFASGGQSIQALSSASVLPVTGLISFRMDWFDILAVQGLSRVFSSTTIQKHQFFGAHPSLWSNFLIPIWLMEKP